MRPQFPADCDGQDELCSLSVERSPCLNVVYCGRVYWPRGVPWTPVPRDVKRSWQTFCQLWVHYCQYQTLRSIELRIQYCWTLLYKALYTSQSGRVVLSNAIPTFLGNVQWCCKYSADARRSHNTYTRYIRTSVYSMHNLRMHVFVHKTFTTIVCWCLSISFTAANM